MLERVPVCINLFVVLESIWDKKVKWSVRNYKKKDLVITIEFEPLEFSDQHRVSICSPDLHPEPSRIVIKVLPMFNIQM